MQLTISFLSVALFAVIAQALFDVVGKQVAARPIGKGPHGATFNPGTTTGSTLDGGSGSFTVSHQDSPTQYSVVAP